MPRALLATLVDVPGERRAAAHREWSARRARLEAHGCRYWVFESRAHPGRFLEFTEAADAATLRAARERSGLPPDDDVLYLQVELS